MTDDKPISAGHVAREFLGHTVDWFYRNREALEARGFPRPLIDTKPYLYDANAVRAWKAATSFRHTRPDTDVGGGDKAARRDRRRQRAHEIAGEIAEIGAE